MRASKLSAILMVLVAFLLLGDQLNPLFQSAEDSPIELTELQEERESKEKSEWEKELEDTDEFLHRFLYHRFTSCQMVLNVHDRRGMLHIRYSTADTPPPEHV